MNLTYQPFADLPDLVPTNRMEEPASAPSARTGVWTLLTFGLLGLGAIFWTKYRR